MHKTENTWPPCLENLSWDTGHVTPNNCQCVDSLVFSLSAFSSCNKANVKFPQPPQQKQPLGEFIGILQVSLDYHFSPLSSWFSCIFLSCAKAYQCFGYLDMSKTARITGLNLSRLDGDVFIQTKVSDEKVTHVSQWRTVWPTFAQKLYSQEFLFLEGLLPDGMAPCFWTFHLSELFCRGVLKTFPSVLFFWHRFAKDSFSKIEANRKKFWVLYTTN